MIHVHVKLFAMIRDIVGADEKILPLPADSPASAVLESLLQDHPRLREWKDYVRIAVNWEYVDGHQPIRDGDEVAIIPPVSGG
jgi:molybdopterin synthase sulfur carrier subunit